MVKSRISKGSKRFGCLEALKRAVRIIPTLPVGRLEPIAEARNGALHLVGVDKATAFKLLVPYLEAMKTMGEALSVTFQEMFGEYSELATSVLQRSVEEAEVRAALKVTHAKQLFAGRYGDMYGEARKAVIRAVEGSYSLTAYDDELSDCPACGYMAKVSGHNSFRDWDYDYDDETGHPTSRTARVDLYLDELNCAVCGLHLEGEDELAAAGVPEYVEVQSVDSSDFEES